MRLSIFNLLLLGTALAVPLKELEQTNQDSQHDKLLSRGLLPIVPRGVPRPVKPNTPRPDAPAPAPPGGRPEPGSGQPPTRLDGDQPAHPRPDDLDVQPTRPDGPSGVGKSIAMDVPNKPNSKPGLDFDKKYDRDQVAATNADFDEFTSLWVTNAMGKKPNPGDWKVTKVRNNKATMDAFQGPEYEQRLRQQLAADNFTPDEINKVVNDWKTTNSPTNNAEGWKTDFLVTMQNPADGAIVVKEMFNKEFDLVSKNKDQVQQFQRADGTWYQKTYTRPGVSDKDNIFMTDMEMDNLRVGTGGDPEKMKKVNKFGFDDVSTPGFDEKMNDLPFKREDDFKVETITVRKGEPGFDDILKNTPHGQKTEQFFDQNAGELGGRKEVTRFEVTETPPGTSPREDYRYDLMFFTD